MLVVGVAVLIAGHGIILYYVSSHLALSAAVVSGVIVLVVIKHLGLLGPCMHSSGDAGGANQCCDILFL